MIFGILMVCSTLTVNDCTFFNSRAPYATVEDCLEANVSAALPEGTYLAGHTCLPFTLLNPDT